MKMIIVVYSQFLSGEVHTILNRLRIKGYSEVPKVFGVGQLGRADDTRHAPGHNACVFAAVEDQQVAQLVEAFQELSDENMRQFGRPAALHAFVTNCFQAL